MAERAVLSVLEVLPFSVQRVAVCVVRCIEGVAVLGMDFLAVLPQGETGGSPSHLTLEKIEWYGREVERLDTVHSGKVTLRGDSAERVVPGSTLTSVRV